jgi:transposase
MAALLTEARDAACAARQAGQPALDPEVLDSLTTRYRQLATTGLTANIYRQTATARDARRIAQRFLTFEDMILRFATRPDLDIFTNNEAERTIRPVKVQQRSSGGCWTLAGLADFAITQSYLSTAAKWASANSTRSATSSTAAPGSRPASNPPDNAASPSTSQQPPTLAE